MGEETRLNIELEWAEVTALVQGLWITNQGDNLLDSSTILGHNSGHGEQDHART